MDEKDRREHSGQGREIFTCMLYFLRFLVGTSAIAFFFFFAIGFSEVCGCMRFSRIRASFDKHHPRFLESTRLRLANHV